MPSSHSGFPFKSSWVFTSFTLESSPTYLAFLHYYQDPVLPSAYKQCFFLLCSVPDGCSIAGFLSFHPSRTMFYSFNNSFSVTGLDHRLMRFAHHNDLIEGLGRQFLITRDIGFCTTTLVKHPTSKRQSQTQTVHCYLMPPTGPNLCIRKTHKNAVLSASVVNVFCLSRRSTESNTTFKPRNTGFMVLLNICLCSKSWSMQLQLGWKPTWSSNLHLS